MMLNMMNDLYSEEATTPNRRYKNLVEKLKEALSFHQQIKPFIKNTLNIASKFFTGFSSFANCKAMRKQILNLEYGLCFSSNTNSFFYFISIIVMAFLLICANWCLFFILRHIDINQDFRKLDDSYDEKELEESQETGRN